VGRFGTVCWLACDLPVAVAFIGSRGQPKAAKVYAEEGKVGLRRVLLRMYLVFLVAVGGFALFLATMGSWTAIKIFGPEYIGLQTVLTLLAVAKLFDSFAHAASAGLFVMERIKENFWVDVVQMVITVSAAFLLIPSYGLLGAALTTLVNSTTSATLRSGLLASFLYRESETQTGGSDV